MQVTAGSFEPREDIRTGSIIWRGVWRTGKGPVEGIEQAYAKRLILCFRHTGLYTNQFLLRVPNAFAMLDSAARPPCRNDPSLVNLYHHSLAISFINLIISDFKSCPSSSSRPQSVPAFPVAHLSAFPTYRPPVFAPSARSLSSTSNVRPTRASRGLP
jgi:hypothetical protein